MATPGHLSCGVSVLVSLSQGEGLHVSRPGQEAPAEQHSPGLPLCATHRSPAAMPSAAHGGNLVVSTS